VQKWGKDCKEGAPVKLQGRKDLRRNLPSKKTKGCARWGGVGSTRANGNKGLDRVLKICGKNI